MIKIGNDKIGAVSSGVTPIAKIYKSDELVYKKSPSGITVTQVGSNSYPNIIVYTNYDKKEKIEAYSPSGVPIFIEIAGLTTMKAMFDTGNRWITSLDLSTLDTSQVTSMASTFARLSGLTSINLKGIKTSNVTDIYQCFVRCESLSHLDLSFLDLSSVTKVVNMFYNCINLETLYFDSFDPTNVTNFTGMFFNCSLLTHIRCKNVFKNWCWTNATAIALPDAMKEGGTGTWEIVD